VCRVQRGGQAPHDAVISATSRAAESLGLQRTLGRVAPLYTADLIAVRGDPSRDITALTRIAIVIRDGRLYRHDP
jgi:imidazolonepropionase-like amidohydrolase